MSARQITRDIRNTLWSILLPGRDQRRDVNGTRALFVRLANENPTLVRNQSQDAAKEETLALFRENVTRFPLPIQTLIQSQNTEVHELLYFAWLMRCGHLDSFLGFVIACLEHRTGSSPETSSAVSTAREIEPQTGMIQTATTHPEPQSEEATQSHNRIQEQAPQLAQPFRPGFHILESRCIQVYRHPSREVIAQIYPVQLLRDAEHFPVGHRILPRSIAYHKWTEILVELCGFRWRDEAVFVADEDGGKKFSFAIDNVIGLQALLLTPPPGSVQVVLVSKGGGR